MGRIVALVDGNFIGIFLKNAASCRRLASGTGSTDAA